MTPETKAAYDALIAKGTSPDLARAMLGLPPVKTQAANPAAYSKDALQALANETLQKLLHDMNTMPDQFKPADIIAACKEALDRTQGKPVQTNIVDQRTTYTILAAIPAPPNSRKALPDIEHNNAPLN